MNLDPMFVTPFGWKYLDGIDNDLILDYCHQHLKVDPDGKLDFNLHPIKPLTDKVTDCVNLMHDQCGLKYSQKVVNSWCNHSNSNQNICRPHTHYKSLFVAIYYLTDSNVRVNFQNPISHIENLIHPSIISTYNPFNQFEKYIEPRKGLLVIHPSWVVHYVDNTPDDRMSIAYNFTLNHYEKLEDTSSLSWREESSDKIPYSEIPSRY